MTSARSPLRAVLAEVSGGRAASLTEVARRVGVSRDEAAAMVEYWVRKGRLTADDLGAACPSAGCGSCSSGNGEQPGCGASSPTDRPVLLAIGVRPPE